MRIKTLFFVVLFGSVFLWMFKTNADYSIDLKEAYYWAHDKSITTQSSIEAADLEGLITRQTMAKMISNFAINVLRKTPDTTKKCVFLDTDISDSLLPHVITSCQLWLMGIWIDKFNPNSVVTRAEFWTILSRVLWWDKYDKWKRHTFYERHLSALKDAWMMNNIDNPSQLEIRWYVFLMLLRTARSLKDLDRDNPVKTTTWSSVSSTWLVTTWVVQTGNLLSWATLTWAVTTWATDDLTNSWTLNSWAVASWALATSVSTWGERSELSQKVEIDEKKYTYTTSEKIIYNTRSEKIYWVLYKPDREGSITIVIYSHGLCSNYESWVPYAKALAEVWIAVYLFDFRWWWSMSKSAWLTTEMSILTEKNDLETVLSEVQKWSFVDRENIILWWASQWWAVTALVASMHSDIKWSILFFPAFSIPELVRAMYPTVDDVEGNYNFKGVVVWKKYATDIWYLDFYKEIVNDTKPVLIVHWTADTVVPISYSEKAHKTYRNSTFKKIEWWKHWFSWKYFDVSVDYVKEFLRNIWVL